MCHALDVRQHTFMIRRVGIECAEVGKGARAPAPLVSLGDKLAKPGGLGGLGLRPGSLCHCSWPALRVVLGTDDVGW